MITQKTMQQLQRLLSLDSTLDKKATLRRTVFFAINVTVFCFCSMFIIVSPAKYVAVMAPAVSVALGLGASFIGVLLILCRAPLPQRVVLAIASGFVLSAFMSDLDSRVKLYSGWSPLVLTIDFLLVMQVDSRYSVGLVCCIVVWLVVLAMEERFRFGLFDLAFLSPQTGEYGREAYVTDISDCATYPCSRDTTDQLLTALLVFVVDFVATRGFAREMLKEQEAMQRTINTVQDIASLLAGYDVEGVARMLEAQETLLPEEMRATLQTLEENLRKYRPYLPAALFEEDEVDGVQHTSVAPPGLETETATIVFTDIRASTSIWECAPDGMGAALKIHNRVMREVMQVFGGYEVKAIGDAFMIAFATTTDGINFALQVHEKLLAADWPASLLEVPICAPQDSLWGGLTVRIGVNTGPVAIEQNTLTGRTDYFGHTVNVTSRLESTCTPGAVAVPSDLWTSDCCACSAVVGETESLDLKGVTDKTFVRCVWPVSLGGRRDNALIEPACPAASVNGMPFARDLDFVRQFSGTSSLSSTSTLLVVPAKPVLGTVGVVEFAVDQGHAVLQTMSLGLSILTVALSQSGGSLVTVFGSRVCVSWNVSRPAPAHMENAIRFAQRMVVKATLRGVGLASGLIQHGDVGARKQRFVTVMGTTVRRSWSLCEEAVRDGVVCLFEPPEGTTLLSALEADLAPRKGGLGTYRVHTCVQGSTRSR